MTSYSDVGVGAVHAGRSAVDVAVPKWRDHFPILPVASAVASATQDSRPLHDSNGESRASTHFKAMGIRWPRQFAADHFG
jgi:hypothetical protein